MRKTTILQIQSLFILLFNLLSISYSKNVLSNEFLWGAAIAEFQNSGETHLPNSNWAQFTKDGQNVVDGISSGNGNDHWNLYEQDINLMKNIGLNSFRLSIDWSIIESEQGQIDESALQHYEDLCDALIREGITPMATLHHFVHPIWFENLGGFEKEENIKYFVAFSKLVFERLHSKIPLWCTINEPGIYALVGYILGDHSPGKRFRFLTSLTVLKNLLKSHIDIYTELKQLPGGKEAQIGIVHDIFKFVPRYWFEPLERFLCYLLTKLTNSIIMNFLQTGNFDFSPWWGFGFIDITYFADKNMYFKEEGSEGSEGSDGFKPYDFIGLNYYADPVIGFNTKNFFGDTHFPDQIMGDFVTPIDPEGFGQALRDLIPLGVPVYITECGCADNSDYKDEKRQIVLQQYLSAMEQAMQHGIDIRGYYQWTLVDNFEWAAGYTIKFGLHDRNRNPRQSVQLYKQIIQNQKNNKPLLSDIEPIREIKDYFAEYSSIKKEDL